MTEQNPLTTVAQTVTAAVSSAATSAATTEAAPAVPQRAAEYWDVVRCAWVRCPERLS